MFGREISSATPSRGKGSSPDDLVERLRKKLASRGARGIIGLSKQFRIMDDNHSMSLDKYEFTKAMQDYMLGFSEAELATLFRTFDFDHSGLVEYDEFLRVIRGPMNPYRKSLVGKAFAKLDRDGNGYVNIDDLRGVYSADKHPDVLSGKKTEQQVLQEFLETFETAHNMRNNTAPDHIVTKEEFEEYYNTISASIDDDQYFSLMINSAWNLDGSRVTKKAWASDAPSTKPVTGKVTRPMSSMPPSARRDETPRGGPKKAGAAPELPPMNYTDAQLVQKFRDALARRGDRAIMGLGRAFKIADDNHSNSLDMDEFKKCIHDFRVGLTPSDSERLFRIFDYDRLGEISYDEFLRSVRGEMNEFRKGIAMQAFNIIDYDHSGVLDISDIKHKYNAKMDPKVISGEMTEDEVLYKFLDTFDQHHEAHTGGQNNHEVTKEEWIEYYNNVSMSIDDDEYFQLMMNNAWNLDGSRVTKKGWGGEF